MKEYTIIFKANNYCFIKILIPCPQENLEGCERVSILFYYNEDVYVVYQLHSIGMAIEAFSTLLKKALSKELDLPEIITKDIGYLWNEDLHRTSLLASAGRNNEIKDWVGLAYLLWSPKGTSTWIYNKNEEIFLEITSTYRWHFSDSTDGEDFITYEEFLKNYQPHLIVKLSNEIALEWLSKTEELLSIMKGNYEQCKYLHEAEVKSID